MVSAAEFFCNKCHDTFCWEWDSLTDSEKCEAIKNGHFDTSYKLLYGNTTSVWIKRSVFDGVEVK